MINYINMKHNLNETWTDKNGEKLIKTETGTKKYYRYLVEHFIGHELPKGLTVHHIDFNHSNNSLENLLIIPTPLHAWIHRTKGTVDIFISNLHKYI